MEIKTTVLYSLIAVWMTLTFIQIGHSCIQVNYFSVDFLANSSIDLDEIQYVATTCWFVEAHVTFFVICSSSTQERELC